MSNERSITAEAASNIAFVKYWGARDLERVEPANPSISMTLSRCRSICSATFFEGTSGEDEILLVESEADGSRRADQPAPPAFSERILSHLDRLRARVGASGRFRIATHNTFPAAAGIASSASGFAALSLAVSRALGMDPDDQELADLARSSGSGSATRSAMGGYVRWPGTGTDMIDQIANEAHWDLCDLVALVQTEAKKVSSLDGHRRAPTSPYYEGRLDQLAERLDEVTAAILERDFDRLGGVVEEDAIDLHVIAMTSKPPIYYWKPGTLDVLEAVRDLRDEGIPAWSTMDAGANVHVICEPGNAQAVEQRLRSCAAVEDVLVDGVGGGPVWREGAEL